MIITLRKLPSYTLLHHFIVSIIIACLLTLVVFHNISSSQFIFIHDEFLVLNQHEAKNLLFLKIPNNLGSVNGANLLVNFYDQLYYIFLYSLGFKLYIIELIYYFINFFLTIFVSFIGFRKLADVYQKNTPIYITLMTTFWYSFNPFTLLYWNTDFSLTFNTFYSFVPICLYYFHKAILEKSNIRYKLIAAILLAAISFLVYLFSVFLLFLGCYTIVHLLKQHNKLQIIKNILIQIPLTLPLLLIFIITSIDTTKVSINSSTSFTGATYGSDSNGFLPPMFFWFTWAIYSSWSPRNILTFYKYLLGIPYLITPFILYFMIIWGIIKKKGFYQVVFLSMLLLFLFFIKGPQVPFGGIFIYLVTHIPIFILFRTPDTKFGFGIVLIISLLLLVVAKQFSKKIFIILISIVVLIQSYPLFIGNAIRGENTKSSWDRIVSVSSSYKQVTDYINEHAVPYGYVIPFPSKLFTPYWLTNNKLFIGQDILSKLSLLPFVYWDIYSNLPTATYANIGKFVNSNNIDALVSQYPIKYLLIRNDTSGFTVNKKFHQQVIRKLKLVFNNNVFQLYENDKMMPIVYSKNISYKMINPVEYKIYFREIKNVQSLRFNQLYDKDWYLFLSNNSQEECKVNFHFSQDSVNECEGDFARFSFNDLQYILAKPLFINSHIVSNVDMNEWVISPDELRKHTSSNDLKVNKDGSVNFTLILYYRPQLYFDLSMYISTVVCFIYFIFIVNSKRKLLSRRSSV